MVGKSVAEIVENLKNIDLSTYPEEQIRYWLNQVGPMASVKVTFHKGKSIMRARPYRVGESRFTKTDELSFKPQECNKTYQRASTPHETMFYGTVVPDKVEPGELDNPRVIAVAETIPFMRDMSKSGFQKIAFGRWEVVEDLNLVAIVHKDTYYNQSSLTRELADAYEVYCRDVPEELRERSLTFQTYLADEFSKAEIHEHYDYMISALFTEQTWKKDFDGIFYPSVRVGGRGFNIAITAEAVKKLRLKVAGDCSVYKLRDHTIVGNDAKVELQENENEFKMVDLPSRQDAILRELGVESIDDLLNQNGSTFN